MIKKVITKTIEIEFFGLSEGLVVNTDFIIEEIKKRGLNPIRWAIVEAKNNILTLSVSGVLI